jgi:hypothetical protein
MGRGAGPVKTLVTHVDFDSSTAEVNIQIMRFPDNVIFAEWKPDPKDLPEDFKQAILTWLAGEQ